MSFEEVISQDKQLKNILYELLVLEKEREKVFKLNLRDHHLEVDTLLGNIDVSLQALEDQARKRIDTLIFRKVYDNYKKS